MNWIWLLLAFLAGVLLDGWVTPRIMRKLGKHSLWLEKTLRSMSQEGLVRIWQEAAREIDRRRNLLP